MAAPFDLEALAPGPGGEIGGIDLRLLDHGAVAAPYRAWLDYAVNDYDGYRRGLQRTTSAGDAPRPVGRARP